CVKDSKHVVKVLDTNERISLFQVECRDKSLNLGDVFILDLGRELYVWMPPESGRLERIKGMACAKNIALVERHGQAQVHILDSDWDQDETFWSHFGGKSAAKKIARARNDDEDYWKRTSEQVTLYKVSDASGTMKVTKVAQGEVKQSELDTKVSRTGTATGTDSNNVFQYIGMEMK
ncbi:hypothetical protein ANCCAN_22512, partial [Ancylostoma caninum]